MTYPHTAVISRDGIPIWANVLATRELAETVMSRALSRLSQPLSDGWSTHLIPSESLMPYGHEHEAQAFTKHFDKYDNLARRLSIPALCSLAPFNRDEVLDALARGDEHLNTLPLRVWDTRHYAVRGLLSDTGIRSWSLSETVCVLKHVAKHYVATGQRA